MRRVSRGVEQSSLQAGEGEEDVKKEEEDEP